MSAGAALDQPLGSPLCLRAPVFADLIGGLDEGQRHVILDLGPARSGLIERLNVLRCRLDVLDLTRHLSHLIQLQSDDDERAQQAILAKSLPSGRPEPVQIVLCWDLLDYLPLAVTARLLTLLRERLAPAARLHALVEYASPHMPISPRRIGPNLEGNLLVEATAPELGPAPRHSVGTLASHLPGFRAERSMLLGNGMQEYLFRFSAANV